MNYIRLASHVAALVCFALAACSTRSEPAGLSVVASIRPLALMVEQLAGDAVQVQTLLPANADPHNMALRISERTRLEEADLVVWLGPEFEQFLQKPMAARDAKTQLVLAELAELAWPAAEGNDHHGHHESHGRDMHLWLNPHNAKVAMTAIYQRLVALDPNLQTRLKTKLDIALQDIEQAQRQIHQQLQPIAERGFGVDHNGYGHFVSAFGLHQLAAVNEIPGQRMSAKQRYRLQQQLSGAACLLVERKAQSVERLAVALQLPVVVADPLANDPELKTYSDFLIGLGNAFHRCLADA